MRLKLVLKIVEGTVLPCNYMYELSSCLYKVLNEGNPVFTAWLHDKGYCKEKKAFKLFTFSNFYFPCFRIEGDRIFVLADTAQLIVSFYPIEAIDAFVMGGYTRAARARTTRAATHRMPSEWSRWLCRS